MKRFFFHLSSLILISLFLLLSLSNKGMADETVTPVESEPLTELKKIQRDVGSQLMPSYDDPVLIIVRILNYLVNLVGVGFLILIIYGGIMWMTARGNEEQAKKAKDIIKAAAWGLVVIILARVLYIFVKERVSPPSG